MRSKRILLGITGGIAAYKIPALVRLLIKNGYEVRCVMSPNSSDFVSPVVLSVLTNHEVLCDLISSKKNLE